MEAGIGLSPSATKGLGRRQGFSGFFVRISAFHLATKPGPRVNPIAVGGSGGDPEDLGRLVAGQAREVTQLDQAGLDRITFAEFGQRGVECEQILVRFGGGGDVGMEFPPLSCAAVDLATFLAGAFDQDASHGRRRRAS